MGAKLGKNADTVVRDLGDGVKLRITDTPAGTRAAIQRGGVTQEVDPRAFGVQSTGRSEAGGGAPRMTIQAPDGVATDYTRRGDGDVSIVQHHGGAAKPKS